jgi:hypothetical protein
VDTPSDAPSSGPTAAYSAPAAANDPVTGELSQIDQAIQNLNGSISGSNAGGE